MPTPRYAKLRTEAVVMHPIDPATNPPPAGSMFIDSTNNNAISTQSTTQNTPPAAVNTAATNVFKKLKKSVHTAIIPAKTPISLTPSGGIVPADSDAAQGQQPIGFTDASVNPNEFVSCTLYGPNCEGALSGLGFSAGDELYLGETGGYATNPGAFSGMNDSIIVIGVADCGGNDINTVATDLIVFRNVVARP